MYFCHVAPNSGLEDLDPLNKEAEAPELPQLDDGTAVALSFFTAPNTGGAALAIGGWPAFLAWMAFIRESTEAL